MIVKILASGGGFSAVRYNTEKLGRDKAELLRLANFGILGQSGDFVPEQIRAYLKAVSATNPKVSKPQFHATISCKGREMDKQQLAVLAEKWLERMGYGKNPYLIIFHSDTANNHVHLVSSRVGIDGKKIDDRFERRRAQQHLRELSPNQSSTRSVARLHELEQYRFTTLAQFRLLLERSGYRPRLKEGQLLVFIGGELLKSYDVRMLEKRMELAAPDENRMLRLRAILLKYREQLSGSMQAEREKLPGGREGKLIAYHSPLTRAMHERFGLEFIFHFQGDKTPYGYTVIDHTAKQIFKGGQLLKLSQLAGFKENELTGAQHRSSVHAELPYRVSSREAALALANYLGIAPGSLPVKLVKLRHAELNFYRRLIDAASVMEVPVKGLVVISDQSGSYLLDAPRKLLVDMRELAADGAIMHKLPGHFSVEVTLPPQFAGLGISPDEDDELFHGRRRRGRNRDKDN